MSGIDNEIHLKKLWISIRSKDGKKVTETAVWVNSIIEHTLLGRGKIEDVDSVKFYRNNVEASKRWRYR